MKTLLFNVVERPIEMRSLGIYKIAHTLREHNWDVEVIDYANFWTLDQLKQLLTSRYDSNLTMIGFSQLFSYWPDLMEEFCAWAKTKYPNLKIISGSPAYPIFDSKYIDYYVRGFGERAVIELLNYMFSNGPRPRFVFPSLDGKKIIDANIAYPAFPMADLMVRYEDRDFIEPNESLTVETSRGCKFNCDFCSYPVLGVKTDHTRSAEDFKQQLQENYDRFGITKYIVTDETFNDSTDKITKYADVVEALNFSPFFSGFIRADLLIARPREREELLRMNFLGQFYGVESFNTASAKAVGKGMPGEKLKQGLIDVRNYFKTHGTGRYRGTLSFIVGLPHETKETLAETKQWLVDHWQGEHFVSYALALQKAELKDKLSKMSLDHESYGYSIDETPLEVPTDQDKYFKNVLNWKTPHMTFTEANKIAESWVDIKQNYSFGFGAFGLHERYQKDQTIDSLLDYRFNSGSKPQDTTHITRYIANKLNLV